MSLFLACRVVHGAFVFKGSVRQSNIHPLTRRCICEQKDGYFARGAESRSLRTAQMLFLELCTLKVLSRIANMSHVEPESFVLKPILS